MTVEGMNVSDSVQHCVEDIKVNKTSFIILYKLQARGARF